MRVLRNDIVYIIANEYCFFIEDNIFENIASWSNFSISTKNMNYYCDAIRVERCVKNNFHNLELIGKFSEGDILIKRNQDFVIVDSGWCHVDVIQIFDAYDFHILLSQIFYTHAVQRRMIQLHSSLIATTDNRGLMFLGPSGIGKTTQAELWHKYRDALIINGDIVFVQETENAFLGWGTPWHGSSPYCENTNVPVEALIVLKQAPENSIRELTGFEKVSEVSNSVFYPRWLENGMELCLETLDHLLSKLPVYELRCRPDEDAVRLTEETIFKN